MLVIFLALLCKFLGLLEHALIKISRWWDIAISLSVGNLFVKIKRVFHYLSNNLRRIVHALWDISTNIYFSVFFNGLIHCSFIRRHTSVLRSSLYFTIASHQSIWNVSSIACIIAFKLIITLIKFISPIIIHINSFLLLIIVQIYFLI